MPRLAYFGTSEFAVPALVALAGIAPPLLVVSQPDRPAGRRQDLTPPPVAAAARRLGLPLAQPENVRGGALASLLAALDLDLAVVASYGRILPPDALAIPRLGCVNLHASLLPRWRGASPVAAAIAAGDAATGVTLMQMDEGLDTGAMLARRETAIGAHETRPVLEARLAELAASLLVESLPALLAGALAAVPQGEGATHAPVLRREDGDANWALPARALYDRWRAHVPWPGLSALWRGERLKLVELAPSDASAAGREPGRVFVGDSGALLAACGDGGAVALRTLQVAGRKPLAAAEFLRGHPQFAQSRLA